MNKVINKYLLIAFAVGITTAVIFTITIFLSYQYNKKQNIQQLQSELTLVTENVRKIMTNSNLVAFSVGLAIDPLRDTITNFNYVAKQIMNRQPYLFGVQILRKGEIKQVYPLDIHESVIGYNILENPESRIEAQRAIDNKEIYYAGPLEFQQGGAGIIGRLPIFHENEFWGFSAVLIKMSDLLQASGIVNPKTENISFQLSKINPNSGKEEFFTKDSLQSNWSLSYKFEESGWKITAYYHQDSMFYFLLFVAVLLALSSSLGSGLYTYQLLKKPEKLEALLSQKTKEINENNEYLTSIVQAIPDLIFIYDSEARYLDFHAYQHSHLFYKPKDFIGKTVHELFDENFANGISHAIKKAVATNEITEHSYYLNFKDGRKYFESRYMVINPEKILAVVREVTESKLSAQKLEKSEQKYRNLVSQASDAIFLSDEKGELLELNEKGYEMTGIPSGIDMKFNLNDLIDLEVESGKLITDIVHETGMAMEEVYLVSKDNRKIPVEINCKITPERQIQGIIRDISSRKKFIESIQKQNEIFREIAWIQSHKVREPLARLLALLDFLESFEKISGEDRAKAIESLRKSANELDDIIREVVRRTELAENAAS